jgi:RTX calcium-binding nonapeptide repeat (4 copies)
MQNSSDPTVATNVNPESFKSQLKKLSGKSQSRKASYTGSAFDGVVDSKTTQTKSQVTKIKRLSGQEEPDNANDSSQNVASNSASTDVSNNNLLPTNKEGAAVGVDSVTPASNSVRIASLSMNEPQDSAKLSNTAFESQADTIVAQASMVSTATIPAVASAPSFSLLGLGAGLGGLALAGSKGGSSGGSASSSSTTATPTVSASLSGFIAAGPIINPDGLKVEAFDASGNLLASTTSIQADGTFTVNLNKSYTGVIKVVVSDTNGNTANFVDEATGLGKSLGATPLVTIFNLAAGQTTFSVNVNPLTTEAANNVMATVNKDLTKATSAVISKANLEIATKYGLSDASNQEELLTDPPSLLIDSKGVMNPKFDPYGLALAIKSVMDNDPSLSMKDAVKALAQNPLYSGWSDETMSWTKFLFGFSEGFLTNSAPTSSLTISGDAAQNKQLTAPTITDLDGIPTSGTGAITYQWQSSSDGSTNWSNISSATASTFTPAQLQVGKFVRVVATYTDTFNKAETVTSNSTAAITPIALTATQLGAVQSFAAGDLNADGISDWLFVYRGGNNNEGGLLGKAYVIYGNTSGVFDLSGPASGVTSSTQVFALEKGVGGEVNDPILATQVGILPIVVNDFNGNGVGEVVFASQRKITTLIGVDKVPPGNYLDFFDAFDSNSIPRITNFITDITRSGPAGRGYTALSSGDINGDGLADLFISDFHSRIKKVFVLFGDTNLVGKIENALLLTDDIKSSNTTFKGFYITDSNPNSVVSEDLSFGWAVSYLGDTNGDGYGDLAIANSYAGTPSLKSPEEIFVIYGGAQIKNTDLDVNQIRTGTSPSLGYVIKADPNLPFLACDAGLNATKIYGDFNGDGRNDFIFEGQTYDHTAAKFYVVFGRQNDNTPINLNSLGNKGFTISLPSIALANVIFQDNEEIPNLDIPRETATNCGDLNGDGIDDILIKLTFNTTISTDSAQKLNHFLAYVVYGKTNTDNVDLNDIDDKGTSAYGYKIVDLSKKIDISSNFLGNITAPGDINGDAIPDLILDDYTGANNLLPTVKLGSTTNALLGRQTKFTVQGTGTSGNDTINLNTSNVDETLVGGAGDDVIYGNGGADVMYGGVGNDTFNLTQNNIDQLTRGASSSGRLARVDGGGGTDTLALSGTGVSLDLTQIANNRLQSIEKINLGASNSLKVSWSDIQNMAAMNLFNKATGWTGLGDGTVSYHQMVVDGQQTSNVDFANDGGGWVKTTTASSLLTSTSTSQTYDLYTNASHAAQLLINTKIGTVIF